MSINACISTKFGSGTHQFEVPPSDFPGLLIGLWISELTFTCSATFMKLSVLVFYLRLAVTRTYKIVIWGSIAFIICWGVGFVVFVIFVSLSSSYTTVPDLLPHSRFSN
jgi:hypothetical protein